MIHFKFIAPRKPYRYDGPTPRQADLLRIIRKFLLRHGCAPSVREMGLAMGDIHVNAITGHLKQLLRKGLVRQVGWKTSRGWLPVVPPGACPCCGQPLPRKEVVE